MLVPFSECVDKAIEQLQLLQKQVYIDGDYIVFNVVGEYDLALAGLNTERKILRQVLHMSEKSWMTLPLLRQFILLACHANKIPVR